MRHPSAQVQGVGRPHASGTPCLFYADATEKRRKSNADRAAEEEGKLSDDAAGVGDQCLRQGFTRLVGCGHPIRLMGGLIHGELLKNVMNEALSGPLARPRSGGRPTVWVTGCFMIRTTLRRDHRV
ncbi:MAG: hypothetical protein BGP21_03110 [Thiobacillus sp. 65-29]|jgi:hypothetical protein|nr:MAG: hypothetical protein BGP21_03110 [Thiobacillus sp. 65-29]